MIIVGDGIMLDAGGESASIFVTGLSETDSVSATKDGKTIKGKWGSRFTAGHPECIISTADYLLYSYSGRNYKKAYSGDAYACTVRINSGWLCPLLVSKNKDSVAFYTDGNYSSGILGYELTVTYLGETWYVSSGGAAYQATAPDSSNVVHLNTLLGKTWDTRDEAALAFLEYAAPQPIGGFEISPIKSYGTYTITATDGTYTKTQEVLVDAADTFAVQLAYIAHPEMAYDGTGLIATISGRTYQKVNIGEAIICGIYTGSYTGPFLISKIESAVSYLPASSSTPFTSSGSTTYNGETWYYSSTEHYIAGNQEVIFSNVVSTKFNFSTTLAEFTKTVLDYYFNG